VGFSPREAVIFIVFVLGTVASNDQRKYIQAKGLIWKRADLICLRAKLTEEATPRIGRPYADAQSSVVLVMGKATLSP